MLNIITALEDRNNWWEMSGGKLGTLVNSRHMRATLQNERFNYLGLGTAGSM